MSCSNFTFKKLLQVTLSIMALSGLLSSMGYAAKDKPVVKVTHILPTELFYTGKANDLLWRDACDNWVLTAAQIEQFFNLSQEYQTEEEYIEYAKKFIWSDCSIMGKLQADNKEWKFELNASGAAEWRSGNTVRSWGCSSPLCSMFLIPESKKPVIPKNPDVRILEIHPAEYDKRYDLVEATEETSATFCQNWSLSAEQAQLFFTLSDEYLEGHFRLFYWLPCNVNGVLESEGRKWNFSINQAASAIWRDGDDIRLWNCTTDDCQNLGFMLSGSNLENVIEK